MATFDIIELNKIGYDIDGKIMQIPDAESIVTTQQLTIGSTSVLPSLPRLEPYDFTRKPLADLNLDHPLSPQLLLLRGFLGMALNSGQ